jgi:heptosyltransferase III
MQHVTLQTKRKFWIECIFHTPIRKLRAAYRFVGPHLRTVRSLNCLRHNVDLMISYWFNKSALYRHLKKSGVSTAHRKVIAISQVVHLGDIVACEPIVRQIRSENPQAFIVFALHRNYRELADSHPEINHVLPVICVSEWVRFAGLSLFDRVIDLNVYGRTCEFCQVPWHKPDGNFGITVDNYFNFGSLLSAFSKSAGITSPCDGPRVYPSSHDLLVVDGLQLPPRYVCLHAGSNEAIKDVQPATWSKIVTHINNRWGLPVVEIGLKQLVITADNKLNRSLCGKLSILKSAEVIRRSILYLGSDSGPAHLANGVGTYGVIALGHYRHFLKYMPYSGYYANGVRCAVLHHDGPVSGIPIERIVEAIDRYLSFVIDTDSRDFL